MKAIKANVTKGFEVGSRLIASDNSGAKIVRLVSVKLGKARKRKRQTAGVGDVITVSVKTGIASMKKKLFTAVIIRQKKSYKRSDGTRIKFGQRVRNTEIRRRRPQRNNSERACCARNC